MRKETRMSEDDFGLGLKVHEDAYRELERERDEWKAKYIQQNKDLGCEMMDPSGTIWDYASATQRDNVQLKREVERERALANEAIATWKKTREERDEAREQRDRLAEALWSMLNQDDMSAIRAGILLRSLGLQSPTNPNEL
jgi:predicted  nucleic acid-binding Zn-ribbon protein